MVTVGGLGNTRLLVMGGVTQATSGSWRDAWLLVVGGVTHGY